MRLATKLRELLPFGILDLRTRLPLENHGRSRVFLRGANAMCNRLSDLIQFLLTLTRNLILCLMTRKEEVNKDSTCNKDPDSLFPCNEELV
jgi:hypothetical protein